MGEGSESCRLCVGGVGGKGWHMDRSWDPTGVSATADCRPPADPWQSFLPPNPGLLGCARPALRAVEEGAEGDGACRPDLLSGLVGASGVGPLSGAPLHRSFRWGGCPALSAERGGPRWTPLRRDHANELHGVALQSGNSSGSPRRASVVCSSCQGVKKRTTHAPSKGFSRAARKS